MNIYAEVDDILSLIFTYIAISKIIILMASVIVERREIE